MVTFANSVAGLADLRRLSTAGPLGCCTGMQADIQRIQAAARQVFGGALGQASLGSLTLGRMLASLKRQIEAGRDLQAQLVGCGADDSLQAELADLIAYFETVAAEVTSRLGSRPELDAGSADSSPVGLPFRGALETLCEARDALSAELKRLSGSEPLDRVALERLREAAHALTHLADSLLLKMTRRGTDVALVTAAEDIFDAFRAFEEQVEGALEPDRPDAARTGPVQE